MCRGRHWNTNCDFLFDNATPDLPISFVWWTMWSRTLHPPQDGINERVSKELSCDSNWVSAGGRELAHRASDWSWRRADRVSLLALLVAIAGGRLGNPLCCPTTTPPPRPLVFAPHCCWQVTRGSASHNTQVQLAALDDRALALEHSRIHTRLIGYIKLQLIKRTQVVSKNYIFERIFNYIIYAIFNGYWCFESISFLCPKFL